MIIKTSSRIILHLLFLVFFCANLSANESDQQDVLSVNGFFTLDLSYADESISVISNGNVPRELEGSESTFKNSVAGLQLQLDISSDLSAFLQASAFYDTQNELDNSLDWAYLRYDLGNDYDIRMGRFLIPFLQGTELKSLSYSRLWARPLVPGSGAGGFIENEGIELLKRLPLEDSFLSFQFILAEPEHQQNTVIGDLLGLVAVNYEWGNSWLRAAMVHADYDVFTPSNLILEKNATANMLSIETELQLADIIFNAGISESQADISPDDSLAYLSIAYPVRSLTPYILATRTNQQFEAFTAPVPAGPAPPPSGSGGGPPPQRIGDNEKNILSIGFRYDFRETYAVKVQLDHIKIDDDSIPTSDRIERSSDVFTILLEGVF